MILVTGSSGLVGRAATSPCGALVQALADVGRGVRRLDLADPAAIGDTREPNDVRRAVHGVRRVVHLAAVSRVVWGEWILCPGTRLPVYSVTLDAVRERGDRWPVAAIPIAA